MPDSLNPDIQSLQLRLQELHAEEANLKAEIIKKTRILKESRAKLSLFINEVELLKNCLISLQDAESIESIEIQFLNILAPAFELAWIKILDVPDDQRFLSDVENNIQATYLQTPLFRQNEQFGSLIAVKIAQMSFTKSQVQFFSRLSDAISITVDRIQDTKYTALLKEEWQETFIALQHPVALIDQNYDLIQVNQKNDPLHTRKKCYEYLFHRTSPCGGCERGKNFFIDMESKSFEVLSQTIQLPHTPQEVFIHTYVDITEARNIHKKMLETAKAAELGLIGSSIAHEINNPLGGLLSYVQLIKMDLKQDDPYYTDFIELEQTTKRCIEIVRDLLEQSHTLRSGQKPH